jgi:stress response protein SCP2
MDFQLTTTTKNQITGGKFIIGLGYEEKDHPFDIDFVALPVRQDGTLRSIDDVVLFSQPNSACGTMKQRYVATHLEDCEELVVDLSKCPAEVSTWVIGGFVNWASFGRRSLRHIKYVHARALTTAHAEFARWTMWNIKGGSAFAIAQLQRKDEGNWHFEVLGKLYDAQKRADRLMALLSEYLAPESA